MTSTNLLLASLATHDLARLLQDYETVPLARGSVLARPNEPIEHVHFIDSGVVSLVRGGMGVSRIEVGMIGREGLLGHTLALGVDTTPYKTTVQFPGVARRVPAHAFAVNCQESASFRGTMLRYAQIFAVQIAEMASSNGRLALCNRLARWLLMTHDRLDGGEMAVTHDAIAEALSVRRPGVTAALHVLEGEHLIRSTRGRIEVRNRPGLEALALDSYGVAEAEYRRLIEITPPSG